MKPLLAVILIGLATPVLADAQPYAGQDARAIKAMAPERAAGLLAGAGLGYAKAAELNGWPGPLHALELAETLALNPEQAARIEAIRLEMLAKAQPLGAALIEAETALDALFASGAPDAEAVAAATARVAEIEGRLRAAHLSAHLETKPVLTRHQRMLYAQARGYNAEGGHSGHSGHGGGH